ncbi:PH (Pleckstrin Homology) domain-containing protein [Fluviicoccus keumensis]|uniref:PH (Pleckstrin Homology) domain-containing protein n=1 Tax=Fluviicoccus keumensis TaxID=1435465 RepID=A0A4Q7YJG1_9GAMM|nr:PH domain-containing protein [Fluviicoccus keumensis]RZU36913.1 PH (Pleckstrin Homology) domain-containing protein [Fluviicoccus keumensis]
MLFPAAPWPFLLKLMTGIGSVVLLGMTLALSTQDSTRLVAGFPFVVWVLCAVYMVRGFRVDGDMLYIRRLFQETRVPLTGLKKAEHRPEALLNARRRLGNGGLFAFTGQFHNQELGGFRLYATDPLKSVILHLPGEVVVVTPADPDAFRRALPPTAA